VDLSDISAKLADLKGLDGDLLALDQVFDICLDLEPLRPLGASDLRNVYPHQSQALNAYAFQVNRESKTLFTQVLFSYKVNPRTVLFLGYSDNSLGLLDSDLARTSLTRQDRTFFLKLGYAWRP